MNLILDSSWHKLQTFQDTCILSVFESILPAIERMEIVSFMFYQVKVQLHEETEIVCSITYY